MAVAGWSVLGVGIVAGVAVLFELFIFYSLGQGNGLG